MSEHQYTRFRLWLTVAVALAACAHLAWEHFNGGIVSHNILNRADLPSISNAWGLLLLPALTWWLSGLALRRTSAVSAHKPGAPGLPASVIAGFSGGLALGIALASSFAYGFDTATSFLFFGLFALALLVPVYRAECVLGFVLGMTFTFGAVLPTAVAAIIAAVSAIAHFLLWRPLARLLDWTRQAKTRGQVPAKNPH